MGGHGHGHRDQKGQAHHSHPHSTRESVNKRVAARSSNIAKPPCCSSDPVSQLDTLNKMASVLEHEQDGDEEGNPIVDDDFIDNLPLEDVSDVETGSTPSSTKTPPEQPKKKLSGDSELDDSNTVDAELDMSSSDASDAEKQDQKLEFIGYKTALAIGFHNFPEGLATFVATLEDPRVGAILAFAIAVHNIPEGLCVSLPIYYATGSRLKGFIWGMLSGVSELIAAIFGWIVLASAFGPTTYAVLFGLVAGMMVIITVHELLPTAHCYDPDDVWTTYSFVGGMMFMAFSMVLFKI